MALSSMLNGITLIFNVLASHVEDHGWTTAVLNSCIAAKLDQVRIAQKSRNVVASLLDFLYLLDSEAELSALGN